LSSIVCRLTARNAIGVVRASTGVHGPVSSRMPPGIRQTLGFAKTERLPDVVIGLFINRDEFGRLCLTQNQQL
jgi:hypothetical protein